MNSLLNRKTSIIVIIALLLAALGLFIWAVATQRFELRKRAVSGEPSASPIVVADDLYFDTTKTSVTFTTTGQSPNVSTDPNKLVAGKTYTLAIDYQIQNTIKTNSSSNSEIPVIILVNGNYVSSKNISYDLIAQHTDGAGDNQTASFTAAAKNSIEVVIDPSNILTEGDETNNTLALSYPESTASPTATSNSASCTRGIQSVSLEPSSQSGYRGKGLTYTVTVRNNDDSSCSKADFTLSAILPYANWTANFAQTVLSIQPQTSASTTVIFTSSTNSPYGTLPVGVNTSGPKASLVAAANYVVLTSTASPYPTAETVYLKGSDYSATTGAIVSPSPQVYETATPEEVMTEETPQGPLSKIPTAVIYGIGGFLLVVLFFILKALFSGGKKNNPPKMTPPTQAPSAPPAPQPQAGPVEQQTPFAPQGPQLSHSVEAPLSEELL